jgi:hypothetical protein
MKYKSKKNNQRSVYKRDIPPLPFNPGIYTTHDGDIIYIIHLEESFLVKELNTFTYDASVECIVDEDMFLYNNSIRKSPSQNSYYTEIYQHPAIVQDIIRFKTLSHRAVEELYEISESDYAKLLLTKKKIGLKSKDNIV